MTNTAKALAALACFGLLLAGAVSAALAQQASTVSTIKEITTEKVDEQLHVLIKIEGPFTFETLEVQAPRRLVIDFKSVSQIEVQPVIEVNAAGVTSIRTGQFQPDVARIVFDLADKAPSHSLTQTENGLKIVFWVEEAQPQPEAKPAEVKPEAQPTEVKPEAKPAEVKPEVPPTEVKPAEVKPAEVKPAAEKPAVEGRRNWFIRLGGGVLLPVVPDTTATRDFIRYAEHGSLAETYSLKTNWLVDFAIGKYFTPSICVGLGVTGAPAYVTKAVTATIPHPFLTGQPRTVDFPSQDLKHNQVNIYAYGLFTLVRADKFELSLGPMLGYALAKYDVLQGDDFSFTEKSPYTSADVTITSQTLVTDSLSMLTAGAWLSGQYQISRKLALVLDARLVYFDAKVDDLGKRANLSSINIILGLQYNF